MRVAARGRTKGGQAMAARAGDYVKKDQSEQSPWLMCFAPRPLAAARLFCFPYAGGGGGAFRGWAEALGPTLEVWAVQLPGRQPRMREPPWTRMDAMARAVAAALRPYSDKPFALFGHSMGAKLGFEVARRLRRERARQPAHLAVSGCPAAHMPSQEPPVHTLPEAELLDKLRKLNGTPREVLEHSELMGLLAPVLRADFEAVHTYVLTPELPLDLPISAYGGLQDAEASREQLEAWREHTSAGFVLRMLPGDHFFLHSNQRLFLHTLARDLLRTPGLYVGGATASEADVAGRGAP
jgi:medium-chain acyl-[acyl-carrier-protein] hydrolase